MPVLWFKKILGQKKNSVRKNFGSKKSLGSEKIWAPKLFWAKKLCVQKKCVSKRIGVQKYSGPKRSELAPKIFLSEKNWLKQICDPITLWLKKGLCCNFFFNQKKIWQVKGDWLAGWLEKVAREGSCNTYNNGANLVYLPLSRKFSLQYTYPGGWLAGWSV